MRIQMRKYFNDLKAITEEQVHLDMLESLTLDVAQQILQLNEENMRQLHWWIGEILKKAEKETELSDKNKPINPNHPALLVNK
ncbi:MAG: hypothetical protein ACO3HJ_07370 [Methylophilaceae bacterium]